METSVLPQELHASCRPVCLLVQQVTVGNIYVCVTHYMNIVYIGNDSVARERSLQILTLVGITCYSTTLPILLYKYYLRILFD